MRAAIFIDGAYLQKQAQLANIEIDYSRLAEHFLTSVRKNVQVDLLRCYFYHCPPWMSAKPTDDELRRMKNYSAFAEILEGLDRWELRAGKLERRRDGDRDYFEQKRVDVMLSCDLARHSAAGHIQHGILVAGDSDFIPAVHAAKESGVTITLWCGAENTVHKDLWTLSDEVQNFNWRNFPRLNAAVAAPTQKSDVENKDKNSEQRPKSSKNYRQRRKKKSPPVSG